MTDLSLLQDFIAETGEHLQEMESNLLQLEADPDREILNDIFRSAHTIKGSSEYLGLEKIAELSHKLENLLEILRHGDHLHPPNRDMVDVLILARDRIALLTHELEEFQAEKSDVADIIARIDQLSGTPAPSPKQRGETQSDELLILSESVSDILEEDDSLSASDAQEDDIDAEESYEEDYDDELFEIFIQHLKDNLVQLGSVVRDIQTGNPVPVLLAKSLEIIKSLYSSANYMDYKSLTRLYQKWIERIEAFQTKIPADLPSTHPMRAEIKALLEEYSDKVMGRFPKFKDTPAHQDASVLPNPEEKEDLLSIDVSGIDEDDEDNEDDEILEPELSDIGDEPSVVSLSTEESEEEEGILEVSEEAVIESEKIEPIRSESLTPADYRGLFDELEGTFGTVTEEESSEEYQEDIELELASAKPAASEKLPPEAEPIRIEEKALSESSLKDAEIEPPIHEGSELRYTPHPDRLAKQSLRVDTAKIDALMNQVGELVVSRAWFSQLFNEMRELQQHLHEHVRLDQREMKPVKALTFRLSEATVALGRVANELQEGVMKVRMLPIAQLFNRYPRLVRDLIHGTDKKVNLEIVGEETELDKMVIEEISDPLIHIIRNAVDHGCETVEERRRAGKPEEARIRLESYHESNHVVIEVSDDGRGIDPAIVKTKAIEKNFYAPEELDRMSAREIINIIMMPGFSTAEQVSKTSGRGVGMDVVKKNVEKLNGTIEIDSTPNIGTRLRIKIPLTLAIIQALLVRVGGDIFTIPLAAVEETLRVFEDNITTIEGAEVIHLRDSTLSLLRLSEIFSIESKARNIGKSFVVVVNTGMRRAGLVVDALIGQEEAVIKPLVDYLQESSGFSGATILGDGRISLILDVYELINMSIGRQTKRNKVLSGKC
jgi:two-component system chemotaxis sensor kinase CheA